MSGICTTCGQPLRGLEYQLRTQIQTALAASGLTQSDLAARVGISQKHMSQVLTGRTGLTTELAERLLDEFDLTASVRIDPK